MKTRLFALCLLFAAPAYAQPYFSASTIPPTMIAPPYAEGSAELKKEADMIVEMQQHPDPAEVAKAGEERTPAAEMVAGLPRAEYPAVYKLLDNVGDTAYGVTDAAKNYWKVRRPFQADTRIKALIEPHNNPTYPSGHTSGSYTWARVMAMLMPEKRLEFMTRAGKIAAHRVLVGVHYPMDLSGGRELAILITGALTQNAEFQKDLEAAKQELAAHPKKD